MTVQGKQMEGKVFPVKVKRPIHPIWLAALWGVEAVLLVAGVVAGNPTLLAYVQPVSIAFVVLNCIFLFRLWQLAQMSDLQIKKPSPGKAIGFTFIPFFNLYWVFILYRNLALHLNHLTTDNKISVTLLTVGVALVVALGIIVPAGGIIVMIVNFQFYRAAKELLEKEQRGYPTVT